MDLVPHQSHTEDVQEINAGHWLLYCANFREMDQRQKVVIYHRRTKLDIIDLPYGTVCFMKH